MKMPAIFIGHGSPMNAIENNRFTKEWRSLGLKFKPKAILMISAHWYTHGNLIQDDKHPKKINDMYGFPENLYSLEYPVLGDEKLAFEVGNYLGNDVEVDNSWGIDHGAWSVLVHMYPDADVPVVQLSVDMTKSPELQFEVGKKIANLRELGYMIIASGNVVHNLGMLTLQTHEAHSWASSFDDYIEMAVRTRAFQKCIDYLNFGKEARLSVPTPEHYYPLLNLIGTAGNDDVLTVFNKGYDLGSLSMTSYLFE